MSFLGASAVSGHIVCAVQKEVEEVNDHLFKLALERKAWLGIGEAIRWCKLSQYV